jgi:hypothetical protein
MTDIPDYRRYQTSQASETLHLLGAPRSAFTLRKDHLRPSGECGPRYVRDERGHCWYWHTDLEAWAATERQKLSADRPPPPPVARQVASAGSLKVIPGGDNA